MAKINVNAESANSLNTIIFFLKMYVWLLCSTLNGKMYNMAKYILLIKYNSFHFIIIKTSVTNSSEKNTIVYKLPSQPHKHLSHGKEEETPLNGSTKGSLKPIHRPVSNTE